MSHRRHLQRRKRAQFRARKAVVEDRVKAEIPQALDVARIVAQKERRQRAVQRAARTGHFVIGFAEANQPLVRVDAHEQEAREFFKKERFNFGDVHESISKRARKSRGDSMAMP